VAAVSNVAGRMPPHKLAAATDGRLKTTSVMRLVEAGGGGVTVTGDGGVKSS
jgi:hypothetical protein